MSEQIPQALPIALWLLGSIWVVALIAYLGGVEIELVLVNLAVGVIAAILEYVGRPKSMIAEIRSIRRGIEKVRN